MPDRTESLALERLTQEEVDSARVEICGAVIRAYRALADDYHDEEKLAAAMAAWLEDRANHYVRPLTARAVAEFFGWAAGCYAGDAKLAAGGNEAEADEAHILAEARAQSYRIR